MTSLVALNSDLHGDLKVKHQPDFAMAKGQNILPVAVTEFVSANVEFLIAFLRPGEGQPLQPVIMTGLKPEQSLYTSGNNWEGVYLPAILVNAPFKLAANPENANEFALAIDMDSELVSKERGNLLYDENGKETQYHEERRQGIINAYEHGQTTLGFVQMLESLDLFNHQRLTVDVKGEKINLEGLHFIDEKKLNELTDEKYKDLRDRGFLPAIYAHMLSMQNIHRLVKMANEAK